MNTPLFRIVDRFFLAPLAPELYKIHLIMMLTYNHALLADSITRHHNSTGAHGIILRFAFSVNVQPTESSGMLLHSTQEHKNALPEL